MTIVQSGILEPIPAHSRYQTFALRPDCDPRAVLRELATQADGGETVVAIGVSLSGYLQKEIPGLRTFPAQAGPGVEVPSTPGSVWCWLRGEDRGELFHRALGIEQLLVPAFDLEHTVDGFKYAAGLDLTGYEDGTENPQGDTAIEVATVSAQGPGLDGSSFVAVQLWLHDFELFQAMGCDEQDNTMGRRRSDNEELDDAPDSAHVKRTAQESFEPEAFVLRRSMPWADDTGAGLNFVAFGRSFDAFEAQLRRMTGAEDGIADALFRFTRPVSGAYFWCPPMKEGRLDMSALGI